MVLHPALGNFEVIFAVSLVSKAFWSMSEIETMVNGSIVRSA
jgi:hypothetical protein